MWHIYNTWGDNVSRTIFMKLTPDIYLMKCLWHVWFQVKRSKVKVTLVVRSFCRVRSVAQSLFDRITSYVAYIQHMRGQCVAHHFQVQRSRSHGLFAVFAVSAPWFRPYLTESLHMWHMRGRCVADHFQVQRSKVKVTRVVRSFCCVRSVAPSLFDRITSYTTHEGTMCRAPFSDPKVEGQGHMGCSKFLPCPLRGSVPIWLNNFICGTYTTHEGTMCHAPFSGPKSKGKIPRVVRSFCCVCSVAPSLFDRITSYVAHIQPMRGRCVTHHFQVRRSRSHRSFQVFSPVNALPGAILLRSW